MKDGTNFKFKLPRLEIINILEKEKKITHQFQNAPKLFWPCCDQIRSEMKSMTCNKYMNF